MDKRQAERMVRTIKDATTRTFHYGSIEALRRHVRDWLTAYNFAKQLKALRFKIPFEAIRKLSEEKPDLFIQKPDHHTPELNTSRLGKCRWREWVCGARRNARDERGYLFDPRF